VDQYFRKSTRNLECTEFRGSCHWWHRCTYNTVAFQSKL